MYLFMYLKGNLQLFHMLYTLIAVYLTGYGDLQVTTMMARITSDSFFLLSQTEQLKNNQLLLAEAIS